MRTTAYLRISKEILDIDNQEWEVNKFCKEKGFIIDKIVKEVISGANMSSKRKIWKVVDDLSRGDNLVVTEISRLGRSLFGVFEILQKCLEKGIIVYSIKQNWKLGDDIQSKIMAMTFGLASEIERELISLRTKEALKRKKHEAEVKGERFNIGWKKGRCRVKELAGKENEIREKLKMKIMKKNIANDYGISTVTLNNFIRNRKIAI
jgi:DNA invertase Pin-like site-specific DNA recombinase